jgi:type VI secretion system secreted protein Hcp
MAVDYFLKIDGIDGESKDHKRKGDIDLISWSWGEAQTGSMSAGGGGGAGKVSMQDFHFVMKVNKSTPKLIQSCAAGDHIKKAILTCRKAGTEQQEFLIYKFYDLLVASYQTGGSTGGDEIPSEQVSLNYSKMEVEYKEQKADGTLDGPIKAGWDLKLNKKV